MIRLWLCATALWVLAAPVFAIDHDNVDGGRPLRFDDAEAIAFRERAIEFGLAAYSPYRRGGLGAAFSTEYLYGFAVNSHFSLDLDSSVGARGGSGDKRFDVGNVGLGVFHNFNRETLTTPAYAVRADAYLPTGRGTRGVALRLRGVMSRTFQQYNRVHVNVDANLQTSTRGGDRSFSPAVTVGFTRPLGYPTYFNRTGLAEIGVRASEESGRGAIFYGGVGIRQQVTVRSALDLGARSDFAATNRNAARDNVTLVAGYSTQF
ncbi:MAG: hypothetical protein H7Y38_13600 [Armatimonadetes bacterium]|nr:hypothetical protein [Armatimonadota bacterium]